MKEIFFHFLLGEEHLTSQLLCKLGASSRKKKCLSLQYYIRVSRGRHTASSSNEPYHWSKSLALWGADDVANLCSYLLAKKRPSSLPSNTSLNCVLRSDGLPAIKKNTLALFDLELILKLCVCVSMRTNNLNGSIFRSIAIKIVRGQLWWTWLGSALGARGEFVVVIAPLLRRIAMLPPSEVCCEKRPAAQHCWATPLEKPS